MLWRIFSFNYDVVGEVLINIFEIMPTVAGLLYFNSIFKIRQLS